MPMLQWMRQMIFKTKSMYTKHKLEFELSTCFMGFIRKIISLIYNSLYSFNKKLMIAKNIKMEDIRGLGKGASPSPYTEQTSNSVTADTENIAVDRKSNETLFKNNARNNSMQNSISESITQNMLPVDNFIKNYTKHIETSLKTTNELEKMYVKLFNINDQLERNLNRINRLYENITIRLDNFDNKINNARKQEQMNSALTSDVPNNETQSLVISEDKFFNTVTDNKIGTFKEIVLKPLEEIRKETNVTIERLHDRKEDEENKLDHAALNSLRTDRIKPKSSDIIFHSQNEIPKTPFTNVNDKNTEKFKYHNKYNFTQEQIKIISNRVKRFLNYLSENSGNQTNAPGFSSRQFSTESILDSINSVILYFLGFTPEEESLAYFMSMVGTEMSGNLLRIGSGFNAMRNSELFSCMTHYGSTKFWNWVDSCC